MQVFEVLGDPRSAWGSGAQPPDTDKNLVLNVSMAIKHFVRVELDRAIHKELNDTKFYII